MLWCFRRGPGRGGERCDALDRIYTRLPGDLQRTRTRRRPRAGRLHKSHAHGDGAIPHYKWRQLVRGVGRGGGCGSIFDDAFGVCDSQGALDGGNVVELRYDSREVQLAQLWRRHQFERADACKRVVTLGQLATLGATLNKYDHVGMDTLRRGFSVQHPLSTKGWYMADHDANFCGAARGR